MKDEEVVVQVINELDSATPQSVSVRTEGGDQNVSLPEVVVSWSTTRLAGYNGHNSFGGYVRDASGSQTGVEHHTYWQFEADCILRFYDEETRDETIYTIESAFIPYELDSSGFDSDTFEWSVESNQPRNTPIVEPDWYEVGVVLSFNYVKRVDDTAGYTTIDTIQDTTENLTSLDFVSTSRLVVPVGEVVTLDAGDDRTYSKVIVEDTAELVVNSPLRTTVLDNNGTVTNNSVIYIRN